MRILVLTPSLPYPPIWGFGIRVLQLTKNLASKHDVTLVAFARRDEDETENLAAIRAICEVHLLPAPPLNKRTAQLLSVVSPVSFQRISLYTAEMQTQLDRLLSDGGYDLVQVESSQLCGYRFNTSAPVIVDEHNIEYELLHRMCQTERSPLRRIYNWIEFAKFRREERGCWAKMDGIVMTSDREEAVVRALHPEKPITVAPNGVDVDYFRPVPASGSEDIVLTGLMKYRPNTDAAQYFVLDVLPMILRERPDAKFYIVGAEPPDEITRLAGPHVVVTGTVPDVRPFVERAAVVVVPLRMGSGTRLKVLEGLAMGKAMVSTSMGCEGIAVRNGEHLLIADDAQGIARSVLELMVDPNRAIQLGCTGRELVERDYSWESVGRKLEEFYGKVLAGR